MITTEIEKEKLDIQLVTSGVKDLQDILNLVEKGDYQILLPKFKGIVDETFLFEGNFIANNIAPSGTEVGLFFNRENNIFFVNVLSPSKSHKLKYYPPVVGDDVLVTVFRNRLWFSQNKNSSSCFVMKFFRNQLTFDWGATRYRLNKVLKTEIANRLLAPEKIETKLKTSDFHNFKFSTKHIPQEFKMKVVEELIYHQLNNGSLPKHLKKFKSKVSVKNDTAYLSRNLFDSALRNNSSRLELIQRVRAKFDKNKKRKYKSKEEFQTILKKNFDTFVTDVFDLKWSDTYYDLVTTKIIPEM